jgi:hypothetical protein
MHHFAATDRLYQRFLLMLDLSLAGPPGGGRYSQPVVVFDMRMDIAIAVFLLLAFADHALSVLVPPLWRIYQRNVARGVNPFRWIEYSVSASIMIVLIALVLGISDITSLINAFGCNSAMILFGLLQEQSALRRGTQSLADWAPFIFGSIIGIVPWISLSLQLGLSQTDCLNHVNATVFTTYPTTAPALSNATASTAACIPSFVFGIYASLLVLFFSFAVNMLLQYLRVWRWSQPYFSECIYLWLSLIAKSILAWQIYAGSLAGR